MHTHTVCPDIINLYLFIYCTENSFNEAKAGSTVGFYEISTARTLFS